MKTTPLQSNLWRKTGHELREGTDPRAAGVGILVIVKNMLTDLCGNYLSPKDFNKTLCEISLVQRGGARTVGGWRWLVRRASGQH